MKSLMLIDLDAILDTRVACLFEIDPIEATKILDMDWRNRDSDDLTPYTSNITNEEFEYHYQNRTKVTLAQARPTNILKRLAPEIRKLIIATAKKNSRLEDYCLVVNTYPYLLNDNEAQDIQDAIAETLGENTPVRITNMLPHSTRLTNLQLRGYTDYITYDIHGWIQREFGDIKETSEFVSMPEIAIWGPALASESDAHRKLLEEETMLDEQDDPWEFLKVTFAPFVNINWVEVSDMSLIGHTA